MDRLITMPQLFFLYPLCQMVLCIRYPHRPQKLKTENDHYIYTSERVVIECGWASHNFLPDLGFQGFPSSGRLQSRTTSAAQLAQLKVNSLWRL